MKVKVDLDDCGANVFIDRLGFIGVIDWSYTQRKYKFMYTSEWRKLTYDENIAVLEAVKKPVALLNITKRLTS